ncbi:MAG: dihydropteroate synthase [Methanomicrobiales archaeon]|nr:dihydropteroate synthase [Methanomicrobiales archaeon]MDI6875387.1 dihydropteroate synthase [Methanomicrobiales archaeon]
MHTCTINRIRIGGGEPVRLMGVINCSPESFFSGSYTPIGRVYERAVDMISGGADMVDIGGRSTAPGVPPVSVREEGERIDAALAELDGSGITVSVDTMHPEVLEIALAHEIHAVNDICGLANPSLARQVADHGLPAIAMASRQQPGDAVGLQDTLAALALVLDRCDAYGIDEVVLDPGIGKWTRERRSEDDWELCRHFSLFEGYGRPLLAAISRKTFIGELLHKGPERRLHGSLALTALLVERGASIVRSHDVAETADALRIAEKMRERV